MAKAATDTVGGGMACTEPVVTDDPTTNMGMKLITASTRSVLERSGTAVWASSSVGKLVLNIISSAVMFVVVAVPD